MNQKIMSEEAFNELIANIEVVSKLTPYGRKNIKHYFEKLKQENQNLKDKLEQSIAVADTNSELVESYYNENQKLKEKQKVFINFLEKVITEIDDEICNLNGLSYNIQREKERHLIKYNLVIQILDKYKKLIGV